jgi:apolipoprotein N-acyltransferase
LSGETATGLDFRLRWPALWAIAGGAAWGGCHAAHPPAGLAVVALTPLFLLLGARRPFLLGWLHGFVAWVAAVPWIAHTITVYGMLPGWLAALALALLAGLLGFYDGLFAALGARLWRRGDALSVAALPALWVALEGLRAWALTGFPWNLAAYAWTDWPGALPLASWIGARGVSALVLVPPLGLALAVRRRSWLPLALGALVPAALLPVGARFAAPLAVDASQAPPQPLPVAVVQPNTPDRPLFDAHANVEDYQRLLEMSANACAPGRLVIWPESAAWPRDWQDDVVLRDDVERLTGRGCAVLLNTPYTVGPKTYNSVVLVTPGGGSAPPQRVDKRHLVPFGEYVPLRRILPFVGKIARMVGDFSPADGVTLLDLAGERLGVAVCYEVIFPAETARLVAAGATILVTVTNDGWYGDTAAPRQHLRAARFRAAENRRWLLRAAITGISAVVRPDGSLARVLGVGAQGTLLAGVEGRTDRSPYGRAPWLVPALAVLVAAAALGRDRLRARG